MSSPPANPPTRPVPQPPTKEQITAPLPELLVAVRDASTGRYNLLPASSLEVIPVYVVPDQDEDDTIGDVENDPLWMEGRGQYFAAKWLPESPKFHGRGRSQGWEPVPPDAFKSPRYVVREIAGLGKCITHMDAVLFEMPKDFAKAREKARQDRQRLAQISRIFGLEEQAKGITDRYGRNAKAMVQMETINDAVNSQSGVLAEVHALARAENYNDKRRREVEDIRRRVVR